MDQLPKPLLSVQDVEKLRLPVNSCRQSGFTLVRFAPFLVHNDAALWESNQLNWIVIYLLSMNEEEISEFDSKILNQIPQMEKLTKDTQEIIKELANQLSKNFKHSDEIKAMLEKVQSDQDLQAIKSKNNEVFAVKPMGSRMIEIEKSIEKLSEKMEGLGKKIDFIASKFGYQN